MILAGTFALLLYIVCLLALLLIAAGIAEFVLLVMDNKRFYSNARVGAVLKPRKTFVLLFREIFR